MRKMQRTNYVSNAVLKNSKRRDYLSTRIMRPIFYEKFFSLLLTENPNSVICQVVHISYIILLR